MRAEDFLEGGDIGSAGDFLDQPAAPAAAPSPPAIAYDPLIGADLPVLPTAPPAAPPSPAAPRMLAQQPQGDIPGLGAPMPPGPAPVAPAASPPPISTQWTDPLSGVGYGGDTSFEPPPLPNPEILDDYGNRVPLRPTSPPPPTIAQRITDWARRPAAATDPDVIRDAAPPVEAMDDYGRPFQVTPPRGLIGDRFIAPEWMSPENARRQEEWMRRNQRERTLDRRAEATMDARVEIDPHAVSRAGGWDPLSQPANQQAPDGRVTPYPASPVEFLSQIAGAVGRGTLIDAGLESLRPWEVRRDQANLFRQAIATAGREIERMPAEQVQDLVRWARMRLPERTANDFRRAVEFLRSGRMTADEFSGFLDSWMDQSNWIRYLRRNGEAVIENLLPGVNPEFQRTFLGQMARASGTTVGALLVNMLPAGGWINALSFYSQGEAQQLEDAIRAGATNDQIGRLFLQAGGTAGVGGLTELAELELLLRPVVRNPGALGFVMASARNMVRNGAAEGLQEAVQQTLQNLEAGRVYDPRRNLWEDVAENTEIGAAVGALFGALATPFGPRAAQARTPGAQRGAPGGAPAGGEPPAGAAAPPGPAGVGSGSPAGAPPSAPAAPAPEGGVPEGAVPGDVLLGPEGDQPAGPTPAAPAPGPEPGVGPEPSSEAPTPNATPPLPDWAASAPDWQRQVLEGDWRLAHQIGVTQEIEQLAADGLVADQIARQLGDRLEQVDAVSRANGETGPAEIANNRASFVRNVRNLLGIPSQMDGPAWRAARNTAAPVTYSDLMRITGRDEMAIARAMRRLTGRQGMVWQALDEAQRRQLRDMLAAQFPTASSPQSTGLPQSTPSTGNAPAPKGERPGANRPPSVPAGGAPQPGVTLPKVELPGGEDTPARFFARAKAVDEAVARDQVAPQPAAVAAHFGIPEAEARKLVDWVSLQPRSSITRYGDYPHRYRKTADRPGDRSGAEREANRQWLEQQAADLGVDAPADMSDVELEDIIMRAIAAKEAAEAAADEEVQRLEQEARDLADRLSQEAPDADDIPFDPLPDTTEAQPGAGGVQPAGPGAPEADRDMGAPGAPRAGPDAGNPPAGAVGGAPEPAAGTVRSEPSGGERPSEPAGERPGGEPGGAAGGAERPPGAPAVDTGGERPVDQPAAKQPAGYGQGNKVFTADAAAKARETIRRKLGQINSGFDPELALAGMTLAGYHVEAGARKFADFTRAMIEDMGESIRPYLRQWYNMVRDDPNFDGTGMSTAAEVDAELAGPPAPKATPPVTTMTLEVGDKRYPITSYQQASEMVARVRDEWGGGASDFPTVTIRGGDGNALATVSYNGKVWKWGMAGNKAGLLHDPYAGKSEPAAPKAPEPAPAADQDSAVSESSFMMLANRLLGALRKGTPITRQSLDAMAREVYGAPRAEGGWTPRDAYDALELAVNRRVLDLKANPNATPEGARKAVADLEAVVAALPTQTVRTEEQLSHQQFSTPPAYAYIVARAAAIRQGETVLEPSAGTGSLVAQAVDAGAKVVANEIAPRRAAALDTIARGDVRVMTEDAAQINNVLPAGIKPTVVLMNPPFSATAGRTDKRDLMVGAQHIDAALKALEPGGRLVAIVGRGMSFDAPTYRAWWNRIRAANAVRANIEVSGDVYKKYGTTFATRVLVIDKHRPTPDQEAMREAQAAGLVGNVATLSDLLAKLEALRGTRTYPAESNAGQPSGAGAPAGGGGLVTGPAAPVPAATGGTGDRRGDRGQRGAGVGATPAGSRGGGAVDATGGQGAPVPGGEPGGGPAGSPGGPGTAGAGGAVAAGGGPGGARASGDALPGRSPLTEPAQPDVGQVTIADATGTATEQGELTTDVYETYQPQRLSIPGAKAHPTELVQSAAMASVAPPAPTYAPKLDPKLIANGVLSLPQMESVVYAGQAHEQMLPAGDGETPQRRGFFIGDGTGVGKGRQIAAIILDNMNRGRTRHVWISKNKRLLKDAQRDWAALGGAAGDVVRLDKAKLGGQIKAEKGIVFATYDTLPGLAKGAKAQAKADPKAKTSLLTYGQQSRLGQLVDWLGKDFDGVIAFDESHMMQSALPTRGTRGIKDASARALAAMELQAALPNARVVYVSATGATEVQNLGYGQRLGLWGRGTPFASVTEFMGRIAEGGIAAMELVARDMKQLGSYLARNLSFRGVEQDRLEHALTPEQSEIYDTLAEAWQNVLRNIHAALELTTGTMGKDGEVKVDRNASRNARSQFWGASLRFWNQIVTSMKTPSLIAAIEADVREGRQAVVQLVNTDEASTQRAVDALGEDETLDDLDITPRDILIQLVEKSFPVQQMQEETDENGKTRMVPAFDSEGKPILNKEAVAMREALLDRIRAIAVPRGALDQILEHFGADKVAEVTGRRARYVMGKDARTGEVRRLEEKRSEQVTLGEAADFQNGKRRILVFSDAGGTGVSYHADNNVASKDRRRVHYVLQPGWRADNAVQGIGRTHRANQASAPLVRLVTTDLKGEKRFITSISRRIAQLGALTKGQREAAEQGLFSARDNLESTQARQALAQLWVDVRLGRVEGVNADSFEEQTGLALTTKDGQPVDAPEITQFLNRILALKIKSQNAVFQHFQDLLDAAIERARDNGVLDVGLETLRADKVTKVEERPVFTDARTGAETRYVQVRMSYKNHPRDFADVVKQQGGKIVRWVVSPQARRVFALVPGSSRTDTKTGGVFARYRMIATDDVTSEDMERVDKWETLTESQARALWEKNKAAVPEFSDRTVHLITGTILPVWDRLPQSHARVVRLQTDQGERFLGRKVDEADIRDTLQNLGAGAQGAAADLSPAELGAAIREQATVAKLVNGWMLRLSRVGGDPRIEIQGPSNYSQQQRLKADGVIVEVHGARPRYFVPTGEAEPAVLRRILADHPVADLMRGAGTRSSMQRPRIVPYGYPTRNGGWVEPVSWDANAWFYNTPVNVAVREKAAREVGALIERILGSEQKVVVADILEDAATQDEVWGAALAQHERERTGQDPDTGRVWREASGRVIDYLMAISTRSENVFRTARHEALHIARRLGIVTDAHWATLVEAAKREGWIDKHEIRDLYPSATEDEMLEEAIAEEFAAWGENNGPEPNTALWRIWARAVRFFRALRAWARDFLKRNPDARDLFQRLEDGLLRQAAGPERRVVNDAGDMMSQQRPWSRPIGKGMSKAEAEAWAEDWTRVYGRYYSAVRTQGGGWTVAGGAREVNPELDAPDPPMDRRLRELEASMEDEATGAIPPSRQAEYQRRVAEIKAEFGQGPKPAAPAPKGPAQLELGGGTGPVSQREATERKMEAPGTRKQQEGRARSTIADLPLFDPNARKQGSLFQMPNPGRPGGNGANQQAQAAVVRGAIERPSAMDWLVRLPFHGLLGGVNERGEWRPGAAAMRLARHLKQSAKVPARFPGAAGINEFLERARIGLIDRYGLDEAYSARDRERQLEAARLMRQGTEHAQWLARQNITAAEARTLHKFLTGELVDNAEWAALFDRYGERAEAIRASVDAMGLEAVSLGLISRESYERNRGTYLHRVYQKYEAAAAGTPEAKVANRAKAARVRFMADEMKGRGLFFNVKVERILGTAREWWGDRKPADLRGAKLVLLERTRETDAPEVDVGQQPTRRVVDRVYWPAEEAVPDRYAGWNDRGTFEVRSVSHDGKDAVIWRDFTPEERERMGEILDARYTIAKTFHLLGQDLATGRFFRDVAANQDWARDSVEADTWINASDYNNWTGSTKGAQWVRVPDEEIPDTGGKKRWGALSGMYVRPEIWRDLHSTQLQMDRSSLMSWWQPILNQWKLNKTARSPVVHMNNVVSNLMLMDMHDIKFSTLVRAVRALAKGDHIYEAAVDAGVFEGGFASVEMRREVLEPLLREIQQQTLPSEAVIGPRGWSARVAFMGAYVNKLVNVAKALDAKMLALYQVEDNVFKLAAYMTRTRMGDDPVAAANYAREAFVDYDIRAPWVQAARKTVLPFISYTYRAVPMMAKLLATKPWKVAKYAGLLYGLNALAYLMWPGDEEAERAALRRENQGYLWALFAPIGYRMLRLWNDEYGRPMFLDLRNWVPGGNFLDSLQSHSVVPLFQWMQPGGPLMVAAELLLNHSAFTGEDIIKERTATAGERVTGTFDYIWKAWMPNAAWVPGSWAWDKVWSASQGVRDRLGRPYGFAEAVVSGMGIKLAPNDVGQGFQIQRNQIGHEIRELQIQLRAARMDWQRGALSQSAYQARVTDLNQRVAERRADLARIGALQQRVPASTRVPFQPDTGN